MLHTIYCRWLAEIRGVGRAAAPQRKETTDLNASVAILRCALGVIIAHAADKDVLLVAGEQRLWVLVCRTIVHHLDAGRALEDLVDLFQCDLSLELLLQFAQLPVPVGQKMRCRVCRNAPSINHRS